MADESKNASVDDALNFTIDDPAPRARAQTHTKTERTPRKGEPWN